MCRSSGARERAGREGPARAFAALLALASPAAASQERLPGDPDARRSEVVRQSLDAIDPLAVGWTSESIGATLGERLSVLAERWLAEPLAAEALRERLAPLLAPGATCRVPGDGEGGALVSVRAGAPFRVRRSRPLAGDAAELAGPDGFARALHSIAGGLAGASDRHAKVKVIEVAPGEGEARVTALLHATAHGETGTVQHGATWRARFLLPAGEPPLLAELAVEAVEEASAESPLLADCTESLFPDGDAWQRLRPGIAHWRARLDQALGLPILGHPAGIAVGDVDGDGLEDLYLCQPGGVPNLLLLHRPDGTVRDVAAAAGVDFLDFTRSALLVDLDGDGDRDLVLTLLADLVLLANDGSGGFEIRASHSAPGATSLTAADYDLDGDLDLYACAYSSPYDGDALPVPYHDAENGQPNLCLRNDGEWSFVDATAATGLDANNRRFSLAAAWEDYDDDGDPDLYVANDFGRNNLYRNDGGRFVDVAVEAGVEDVSAGMGASWADYDGDGRMDLHVGNMFSSAGNRVTYQRRFKPGEDESVRAAYRRHARGDSLFRNAGGGRFEDVTLEAGVAMGRWAWGALFADLDLDGRQDIVVPNGFLTEERADDL
jgi:hypothetical protein